MSFGPKMMLTGALELPGMVTNWMAFQESLKLFRKWQQETDPSLYQREGYVPRGKGRSNMAASPQIPMMDIMQLLENGYGPAVSVSKQDRSAALNTGGRQMMPKEQARA